VCAFELIKTANRTSLEVTTAYDNAVVYANMRAGDLYRRACGAVYRPCRLGRTTSAVAKLRPARELCSAHNVTRRSTWCYSACTAASPGSALGDAGRWFGDACTCGAV